MAAGYSGTPLVKKLGFKPDFRIWVSGEPQTYWMELGELPAGIEKQTSLKGSFDLLHFFSAERNALAQNLPKLLEHLKKNGMLWISWPKKASKLPTTITEDVIRELALPMGLVDVKVCAVDAVWSGLKLVIRKENR